MGKCLHELFAEQVQQRPGAIAVCAGKEQVTYRDLAERADRLGRTLRRLGVRSDILVGLYIDRSIELIVGMLAILKAGGAYVPIDPAYPPNRVRFLIADSRVAALVSVPEIAESLRDTGVPVLCERVELDEEAVHGAAKEAAVADSNLAYVIYTSGTTGQPKGVLIEHRSVVRLFTQTAPWFGFGPSDVWTMFHSPSFDFSVWEIWGALLHGGRLVLVPSDIARSPYAFSRLLREERVTVLNQTPSAFRQLIQAEQGDTPARELALRLVVLGGEKLEPAVLAPWFARHGELRPQLVNMYGITETTVHVTYKPITDKMSAAREASLIGEPIPDLRLLLLDACGQEVTDGAPGELHVAGPGLARGYLNRPALTAERFIERTEPSGTPLRLYRSGDLAVRRSDGELVYLGRADEQVKVRGFRVEPSEIEACLLAHPAVAQAVVRVRDFGEADLRLVAFIVRSRGSEELPTELVRALRQRAARELPLHMRPSQILLVDAIPLTAHGKLDKQALLRHAEEFERSDEAGAQAEDPPAGYASATERQVAAIVTEILRQPPPSVSADLLAAGLTSLALVRILLQLNRRFGVSLSPSDLGEVLSVESLAAAIRAQAEQGT